MRYIFLILLFSGNVQSEDIPNYCHDAETNAYWEDLKRRAADNIAVINLANYRKDLCEKVERGELSVREATDLFELERSKVVDELLKQERHRELPEQDRA